MAVRRIAAHYTLLPGGLTPGVVVAVGGDGTILDVSTVAAPDSEHGVEFYSGILIPGMVNAHCHLELSHLRGAIPRECGFTGFACAMGRLRDRSTPAEREKAVAYRDARMWAEGISAVGDISNTELTFPVKEASPIGYHTFMEVFGLATVSSREAMRCAAVASQRGLSVSVTPHSMYSLNEKPLLETVAAGEGTLSVHFMESRDEELLFHRQGDMWDWYGRRGLAEEFTSRYSCPARRLIATIPPERKILLVHNTFASPEDVRLINGHFGDNVTWVVCPRSNLYITGTLPPVDMLRREGCRIAVGTDSLASNGDLSLIEELKILGGAGLEESLFWATCNGAEALGIYDVWGSIETGKRPGLAVLENVDPEGMRLTDRSVSRRLV